MKKLTTNFLLTIFLITGFFLQKNVEAQSSYPYYGIWQAFTDNNINGPEIRGRLLSFYWKDLEAGTNNNWAFAYFDTAVVNRTKDANGTVGQVPVMISIFVYNGGKGETVDAPAWLFSDANIKVPPVNLDVQGSSAPDVTAPYYPCINFKVQFNELIAAFKTHIDDILKANQNNNVTKAFKKIVAFQGCYGSTGDYISYKGTEYYASQGNYCGQQNYISTPLNAPDFRPLFDTFSLYYQRAYYANGLPLVGQTGMKIHVIQNPSNNGVNDDNWLQANCPGTWRKAGDLGKIYQLNNEWDLSHTSAEDISWWYTTLNTKQSNTDSTDKFIRARSELVGGISTANWWTGKYAPEACAGVSQILRSPQADRDDLPYKNLFTLYAYMLHWGVDWANPTGEILSGVKYNNYKPALQFYNKYAGQKDTVKAQNAFCMLRDGLDANDTIRFSTATYGALMAGGQINAARFYNIANIFRNQGALIESPCDAAGTSDSNRSAQGINDVGWKIIPGNYYRYLYQVAPKETSAGYWNVRSSAQPNSIFGRFARGFDHSSLRDTLFFDIDGKFLDTANRPSNGYHVMIKYTYLDSGITTGSPRFKIFYDSKNNGANAFIKTVILNRTNNWITDSVEITDGYFNNSGTRNSDFAFLNAGNNSNIIFSLIEIQKLAPLPGAKLLQPKQESLVKIQPNPASEHFTVLLANKKQIAFINIFTENGRIVMSKKINAENIIVNKREIGGLPGIYYITVTDTTNKKHNGVLKISE